MDEKFKEIENFIFDRASKTKLPGISITVMKDNDVIFEKFYGFSEVEGNKPATSDTVYGIGSISKSFACLALLKLHEMNLLSIDDPVEKYVDFPLKDVTIRNLMSHTSGIPSLGYAESLIRTFIGIKTPWLPIGTIDDLIAYMNDVKEFKLLNPGERFLYLNEGYEVLEKIVEVVSGRSYKGFLREEIMKPAGLNCYFLDEIEKLENGAVPYIKKDGKFVRTLIPGGPIFAAGGVACSTGELAKYGQFLIKKAKGVLSEPTFSEMEKPHIKVPYEYPYADGYYGLGLFILKDFFGRTVYEHGGSILAYTAHLMYSREDGVSIAVLTNASGYSMKNFAHYVFSSLILDNEKLPFVKKEKLYSEIEGKYSLYKEAMEATVKSYGDFVKIIFDSDDAQEIILVPEKLQDNYLLFYTLVNGAKLPVEFFKENGRWHFVYERYIFRKQVFC
ncbi:MAG: serine hydrolase [Thermotogaceae bacterium]|nr:serine hydrolase [Thermotogaceae bacterium]